MGCCVVAGKGANSSCQTICTPSSNVLPPNQSQQEQNNQLTCRQLSEGFHSYNLAVNLIELARLMFGAVIFIGVYLFAEIYNVVPTIQCQGQSGDILMAIGLKQLYINTD